MKIGKRNFYSKLAIMRIVSFALIILTFPFIAEMALRAFSPPTVATAFQPDPLLFWKLSPNLQNYPYSVGGYSCIISTNADGFRNEPVSIARNERSFRILCLGDETTFGLGVSQDKTFPKQLQALIRKRFHYYVTEVINAGVQGYSTFQGKRLLEDYCLKYKPEIIVVEFLHNDYVQERKQDKDRVPQNKLALSLLKSLYGSQIFLNFRNFFVKRYYMSGKINLDANSPRRVSPADYQRNLEEICSIAKQNKSVLIFISPQKYQSRKELPIYRNKLKDIAEKNGYLIDLQSEFDRKPDLYLAGGDLPSPLGHELIANKLFDLMKYENLIPQRPGEQTRAREPAPINIEPGHAPRKEPAPIEIKPSPGTGEKTPEPGRAPSMPMPGAKEPPGGQIPKPPEPGTVPPETRPQPNEPSPGKPGDAPGSDDFYF